MPVALLDPCFQILKGGHFGDIIDEDNSVDVAVVVLHHAFAEAFLAGRIPHLHLYTEYEEI